MVSMGLWGDIRLSCKGEFSLSLNETCKSPLRYFWITRYTTQVNVSYRNIWFQSLSVVGDTHGSTENESFLFHWRKLAHRPYALQRVWNVVKSRLGTNNGNTIRNPEVSVAMMLSNWARVSAKSRRRKYNCSQQLFFSSLFSVWNKTAIDRSGFVFW